MYYDENYQDGCNEVFAASGSGGVIPDERRYGVKVIISTDGGDVTLCGYDKVQSFEIVSDLTEDDYITFGNASSKQLTLSLVDTAEWRNTDFQPKENQKIQMFLYVDDGTTTDPTQITNVMPIGTYYISEVKFTSDKYSQLTITAFDWMSSSIMNSKWKNDWDKFYAPKLEKMAQDQRYYIQVTRTFATELQKAGLSDDKFGIEREYTYGFYYGASYLNDSFNTVIKPLADNTTLTLYRDYVVKGLTRRQMTAYLAGFCCLNAFVDYSDRLVLKGFSPQTIKMYDEDIITRSLSGDPEYPVSARVVTVNPKNSKSYVMKTNDTYRYKDDKVLPGGKSLQYQSPLGYNEFGTFKITTSFGGSTVETGTYTVPDNYFTNISKRAFSNAQRATVVATTQEVDGTTETLTEDSRIKPLEIKWRGNPLVELGDVLSYETDGETFAFPVCHITMSYNGGLTMTLKSYGFNAQSTADTVENQGGSYNTIMQVASADLFTTQTLTANVVNDNGDNQVLLTKNSNGNTVLGMGRARDGGQTNIYGNKVNINAIAPTGTNPSQGITLSVYKNTNFKDRVSVTLQEDTSGNTYFRPTSSDDSNGNNLIYLGSSSRRWKELFCTDIDTSNISGDTATLTLQVQDTYKDSSGTSKTVNSSLKYYVDADGNVLVRPNANSKIYLGSNSFRFGRMYTKSLYCTDGKFETSDRKAKKEIKAIGDDYTNFVMSLKPVTYLFKDGTGRTHCGFIAQDVVDSAEKTVGDLAMYRAETTDGKYFDNQDDENLEWALNYSEIIAPLTALVQKQQKQIEKLQEKVEKLQESLKNQTKV